MASRKFVNNVCRNLHGSCLFVCWRELYRSIIIPYSHADISLKPRNLDHILVEDGELGFADVQSVSNEISVVEI